MHIPTWVELAARFRKLAEKTGRDKVASYDMTVQFDGTTGEIRVSMFTYDILDWPRHTNFGPFAIEHEALFVTESRIKDAEAAVERQVAHEAMMKGVRK